MTFKFSTGICWWIVVVFLFLLRPGRISAQSLTDSLQADTLAFADSLGADFESQVAYSAEDSIVYDLEQKKIYLYGKARVSYEDISLEAAFIVLDYNRKELQAQPVPDSSGAPVGIPHFKQGENEFDAQGIRYNFETKKGKLAGIRTKEGDSFIHGESVRKETDNTTYIRKGYYTTCSLEEPHYWISSNKIKVIPDNKVVTGPADMHVAGVPTPLAIPFGFFPNKKSQSSGILFPSFGESAQLGFFVQNGGYYFGFSEFFDAALTADIYSSGSWRANLYSNYALRYRFTGNLSVNYSLTKTSIPELPDYSEEEGFFIRWNHTRSPKADPFSSFQASVNAGSSSFYRNNLSSAGNYLTNTFQSSVTWSKTWPGKPFNLNLSLSHNQNTQTRDISLSLPNANFGVNRITPFKRKSQLGSIAWYEKIGFTYTASFLNTISTKDSLLFSSESLDKFRYGIQHSLPVSTSMNVFKYWTLSPSLNYSEKWYWQTYRREYDTQADVVVIDTVGRFRAAREFSASVNLNTRLYGMLQFRGRGLKAIRHVITPSVSYNWRPDYGNSAWGYYQDVQLDSTGTLSRYSIFEGTIFGGPPQGRLSQLALSVDNNLETKWRKQTDTAVVDKKVKILESLALGIAYNFAADSLRWSLLAMSGRTTVGEKLSFNFAGSWDPYTTNGNGQRINTTQLESDNRLFRFTAGNLAFNYALVGKKKEYLKNGPDPWLFTGDDDYMDLSVPFNLAIGYNLFYTNGINTEDVITQTLNFTGDVQMTPGWKFTFTSGYDFTQNDLSYTSVGIYRDLHCWEMRLNWVPFGFQQNYFFQINIKSSLLQDLKLTRKNDRFDNR